MILVETRKKFHEVLVRIDGFRVRDWRGRRDLALVSYFLSFAENAKCREEDEEILRTDSIVSKTASFWTN